MSLKNKWNIGELKYWQGKKRSSSTKNKISKTLTGKIQSIDTKFKRSISLKKAYAEGKRVPLKFWLGKKMPVLSKEKQFHKRLKCQIHRMNQIFPKKDTSIECIIQSLLNKNNILFEKHKSILGDDFATQPDIFIKPNVCVYIDGCYWHGCNQCYDSNEFNDAQRKQIIRDQMIMFLLKNNRYQVLRIWEHDIKRNPGLVLLRIKEVMQACNVLIR